MDIVALAIYLVMVIVVMTTVWLYTDIAARAVLPIAVNGRSRKKKPARTKTAQRPSHRIAAESWIVLALLVWFMAFLMYLILRDRSIAVTWAISILLLWSIGIPVYLLSRVPRSAPLKSQPHVIVYQSIVLGILALAWTCITTASAMSAVTARDQCMALHDCTGTVALFPSVAGDPRSGA